MQLVGACVIMAVLSGCTIVPRQHGGTIPDGALPGSLAREETGLAVDRVMRQGAFAAAYAGIYHRGTRTVVLVTDDAQAVRGMLMEHQIPTTAFEVREVDDTLADLEQAKAAAVRWVDGLSSGGAVVINIEANQVVIAVARQPVVAALEYDPGDAPIPYDQWPESLKAALQGIVPGVDVELRAGFSVQVSP